MQPFKIREGERKKEITSTELLLGIYLTKLNEEEAEESGGVGSWLGRGGPLEGRGPALPSVSPPPRCRGRV